ncbi:hypothetical protein C4F51_03310 [Cellvibrio sp. KB43]|uniref:Uncharacterized protein n=1 Tax=Cellvibrio polysaccharolyticus TaxID=2082724 RepID=A0A928V2Y2_9GAMM|nr:hypothetical protein [Cellvibrio polysaccharolyticus]
MEAQKSTDKYGYDAVGRRHYITDGRHCSALLAAAAANPLLPASRRGQGVVIRNIIIEGRFARA